MPAGRTMCYEKYSMLPSRLSRTCRYTSSDSAGSSHFARSVKTTGEFLRCCCTGDGDTGNTTDAARDHTIVRVSQVQGQSRVATGSGVSREEKVPLSTPGRSQALLRDLRQDVSMWRPICSSTNAARNT